MKSKSLLLFAAALCGLTLLLAAAPANAATRTWDGSLNGNWSIGNNWNGGTPPVVGDDLVFPLSVTRTNMTNNFSPNRAFSSVTFLGTNYTINGSALIVTNGIRSGTPAGDNLHRIPNTIAADVQLGGSQSFVVSNLFTKLVILGDIALGPHTLTIDGDGDNNYSGVISGTGGIEKVGFGRGTISGDNTFSGPVNIRRGTLEANTGLSAITPLGSTSGVTTVFNLGSLNTSGDFTDETLVLSGGHLFNNCAGCTWHGPINVVSNSTIDSFEWTIEGVLSGSGDLTLTIESALAPALSTGVVLAGNGNNTLSGTLQVKTGFLILEHGLLVLDKPSTFIAVSGPLIVGDGGFGNPTNTIVRYAGDNQIALGALTILSDGTLDLDGHSDSIGGLTLIGGTVTNRGSGLLTVNGNIKAAYDGQAARIYGDTSLGNFIRTFTVTNSASTTGTELDVYGSISAGGIVKAGDGYMGLRSANSYDGPTTVSAGSLLVQDDFGLGSTINGTVVNSGATLYVAASTISEPLTLNGDGDTIEDRTGALRGLLATCAGAITVPTDSTINVPSASPFNLTLSGPISGTGNISKTGPGTLILSGTDANVYSGDTTLRAGILELAKTGVIAIPGLLIIGDGSGAETVREAASFQIGNVSVTVNSSGTLDLNGFNDTIGALTLNGGAVETGAGTLTLGGTLTASDGFIAGNLSLGSASRTINVTVGLTIDAVISGNAGVGFTKTGSGELYLFGANTYSGLTTVSNGRISIFNAAAFGSSAAGTVLSGGNIRVENVTVANEPLTNNSASSALVCLDNSISGWSGNIVLNADLNVSVLTAGRLNLSGVISGTGGIIKSQPGTLVYSGSSANSYTGNTTVNEGVLELAKASGLLTMISGQLIIGDGTGGINADVVRYAADNQIPTSTDIVVKDTGLLDLNNFSDAIGDIALIGGEIDTGTGTLSMSANLTATSTLLTDADIVGNLNLGTSARTFTVTNGNQAQDLQISAAVRGSGSIIKDGAGRLSLISSNSYSGLTTVNDGVLRIFDDFALGTTAGGVVLNGDSILELSGPIKVGAESLTNNSTGQSSGISLDNIVDSNSWAGPITLQIGTGIGVVTNTTLNLVGAISGAGTLTKKEPGTLIYSGGSANNYAGVTTVNEGTLVLGKSASVSALTNALVIGDGLGGANADVVKVEILGQLPNTVAVTVNSSGQFEVKVNEDFGSLAGSGSVVVNTASPNGIGPGFNNSSTIFSGIISGTGALTKNGTGTMTLSGNNTYTGTTTIGGGTLLVNGSQPQSPVTVGSAGTLGGSGAVGNINNVGGGVVAPGSSPGILTCGNVIFSGISTDFTVELNGSTAGTGYDQLNVGGTVSLGASKLNVSVGGGFAPVEGRTLTILANDGSDGITGTFTGLAEGGTLTVGNLKFRISYIGSSGNDVTLALTNPPLKGISGLVSGGNGNNVVGPNECNNFNLVITNTSGSPITGISAVLSTTTPAVIITQPDSNYPNIPVNGKGTNNTPFQITTLPGFACGGNISLVLTVSSSAGNFASTFALPTDCVDGGGACGFCPGTFAGSITNTDLVQAQRLTLDDVTTSTCEFQKACPGAFASSLHYDRYTFTNNSAQTACVKVSLTAACGGPGASVFPVTYLNSFDPANICSNYLADLGTTVSSGGTADYSFSVPASNVFIVVVSELTSAGCTNYSLAVSGLDCPPPTLDIARVPTDKVRLSWPTRGAGFVLESNPSLFPANWTGITNQPIVGGTNFNVTNSINPSNQFYRLRKPF